MLCYKENSDSIKSDSLSAAIVVINHNVHNIAADVQLQMLITQNFITRYSGSQNTSTNIPTLKNIITDNS